MVVVIMGMRVRHAIVRVLVRVRGAGSRRICVGVIVMLVVVRVFVGVCDCAVGVRVRVIGHECLLGAFGRCTGKRRFSGSVDST